MNISLSPELEKFVQNKVSSGFYTSTSEVIRESLRLMHTHDNLQQQSIRRLDQAIEIGMKQLDSGHKISARESYNKLKAKIDNIAKTKT
ncbi:MAG: hypothetical protein A2X78_00635 [Gammaproteobacteria bacterium GWE2_37_16]|nr:MAG: hypothetical protein A2X78_00635 [Gammaproteobacteria bacterium GWE2_37_16]